MPPVVPSAVPLMVMTPPATAIWDGRRRPLLLWPGLLYGAHFAVFSAVPSNWSPSTGLPQPSTDPAWVPSPGPDGVVVGGGVVVVVGGDVGGAVTVGA